jgi:WXXGXW repeat (2 copies)
MHMSGHKTRGAYSGLSVALPPRMGRVLQGLSLSALLLACAPAVYAQISFDYHMGAPPPAPRAYRVPPRPGPDYVWVEGYWYPVNGQYRWHNGYWTRPPYPDAYWVAPYYQSNQYYTGHWEGRRGDVHHDHGWDQSRQRDERWSYAEGSPRGTSGAYERGPQRGYGSNASSGAMTRERAQAIVRSAYQNVLGRDPDPASAGWVNRVFNDHWSQQQLENELRNSAEYQQKHPRR